MDGCLSGLELIFIHGVRGGIICEVAHIWGHI